ncbi:hypothetical protein [Romboutsia lituseburensis]|uniref:hypothetical protein n=1 Tax=Romboutsia lituseburensis TaxID=1537 RepID=UPI0022EB1852|nr:hypothetical protein [Romboutsia lituseburensis]
MSKEKSVQIIDFFENMIDSHSEIKDIINTDILENDAVTFLSDNIKFVRTLKSLNDSKNIIMFKKFLKGFNIGEEPDVELIEKLKKYINDEKKFDFISQTLEKILNSKSRYSAYIMGYMVNTLINGKEDLHPKYIILADALSHMFDHDIENMKFIGDYCNKKIYDTNNENEKVVKQRGIYFYKKFTDILSENHIDKDIMYLTLEKCLAYQLMVKNVESDSELHLDFSVDYDKESDDVPEISGDSSSVDIDTYESYELTIVGDLLYELIETINIIN